MVRPSTRITTTLHPTLPADMQRQAVATYRYLLVLTGNVADAEEMVQRVFVKLFEKPAPWGDAGKAGAYIRKMARNEFLQECRRRKIRNEVESGEAGLVYLPAREARPEETYLNRETAQRLQDALFHLPWEQREAIQLRLYEDMPWERIAMVTGTARATLMEWYESGLRALRARLRDREA